MDTSFDSVLVKINRPMTSCPNMKSVDPIAISSLATLLLLTLLRRGDTISFALYPHQRLDYDLAMADVRLERNSREDLLHGIVLGRKFYVRTSKP